MQEIEQQPFRYVFDPAAIFAIPGATSLNDFIEKAKRNPTHTSETLRLRSAAAQSLP
jgi:hypothetical protein